MSYTEKLQQVNELQEEIASYGEFSADIKKKINYRFRLDWNYYSNAMEGNTLTIDETRSVMVGNITVGGKPIKDVMEMKGHDNVISKIINIGKGDLRLSEVRIKEIHKSIMHEDDEEKQKKIGVWKTEPNYILNYKGERFDFVAPADVPERIHQLLNEINAGVDAIKSQKKDAPHPLDLAFKFHVEYLTIHPFYDGNGRTARILTNLLLISFGYPPMIINDKEKTIYYQYLADIQCYGGDHLLLYEFLGDLVLKSQQVVLAALEGKSLETPSDYDKKLALLKKKVAGTPDYVQFSWNEETKSFITTVFFDKFLRKLHEQNRKVKDWFNTYNVDLIFYKGNTSQETVSKDIASLFKSSIHEAIVMENSNTIKVIFSFNKFKVKSNAFSLSLVLMVQFETFEMKLSYEVGEQSIYNRNIIIPFKKGLRMIPLGNFEYKKEYSDEEIEPLVSKLSNEIADYIDKKISDKED